ncbi:disease resistance protein ADR1-like [Bidens hawaiensis]|uniref:disease resistance protein ADR1-like n=1 Tax=Bidens hawaiensis TaxID=980011 RepID=UPI00404978E1
MPSSTIDENIVNEMVKCCKRHPLTRSVVGDSLNGRNETIWLSLIKSLAKGESMLDLNQDVLYGLERSFEMLEDKFKQTFLDFGMFLEDERIPAVVLLDMWVQMYKHDDEGVDTLATIHELSDINLVNAARQRKGQYATFNTHCAHKIVSQHDLLRQLAVNLNSKLPIT